MPIDEVWAANSASAGEKAETVVWGGLLAVGSVSKGVKEAIEAVDVFVGRYLLLTTVTYVGLKFIHFKIFDPFP